MDAKQNDGIFDLMEKRLLPVLLWGRAGFQPFPHEEHTKETKFTYISPFSSSNGKAVFFRLWKFCLPTNNAAFHSEIILHFIEPVPYTTVCEFQIISNCLHRDRG